MKQFVSLVRSSRPEVFLGKGVLKIGSKFTGEHPCRSVISIKFPTQPAITCSKLIIETVEQGVKYVQS